MNSIAFGRYIPTNSWLHKIDPRFKMVGMILMLITIFVPCGWWGYGFFFLVLSACVLSSGLGLTTIIRSMKPMLIMMIFLLIINSLTMQTGQLLFSFGGFKLYSAGLLQTAYIGIRLILMIMTTTLLTATTKPLDMTLGIEDLLSPLAAINVPHHEIALMISIALRFIPTLIEETNRIMKAQSSRGVDFQEGKLKERIGGIVSLIVPLFVSAFSRAEDLADAMEARGYIPGAPRTRYKQLVLRVQDYVFLLAMIGLLGLSIALWLVF